MASRSARADERTEARSHFKKGMAEIADGRYDVGIEELKKAYDILPHPNVVYNIARAYVDTGDLESAVVYYRKYLESNPADRDDVARIVTALEARIRRQQAELAEATTQQATPAPPRSGGATPAAPTDVAPRGPGIPPNPTPLPPLPIPSSPASRLKTEEVFEETVVTASKTSQSPLDAPNSTSIITEQDIRLTGITKIPELLRRLAGVDIGEDTGAQTEVSLRGFNQRLSNKVLVLVDGRSVYVDLLGVTFWSLLSIGVEDIERIEVVRGPGSALYGADAFNGVINIITKRPGEGGSGVQFGYGDHDTTHGSAWASGRDHELSYRLSAGYDYLPRWSREVPAGRVDLHVAPDGQDVAQRTERLDAVLTRQLGRDVTLGVQGGYVQGGFEVFGDGPLTDVDISPVRSSDVTVSLQSRHVEARAFYNHIDGSNQLNAAYLGQSALPAHFNLNVVDGEVQYIDDFETGRGIAHDLHVGGAYRLKSVSWTYQERDQTENHAGFFVHDEIKVGRRFAIIGDYRADYVPYLARVVQSPRGSILFHPSDQSTLRGVVATAFRTPTFLESYLGFPLQLPVAGGSLYGTTLDHAGAQLAPEQIFTTEIGYLNSESDFLTVDTAAFYNHAQNLIDLEPIRPVTVGDISNPKVPTAPDPASGLYPLFYGGFENECQKYDVYGAELGARAYPREGLDLYANYTFMDVRQDNSGCSAAQLALLANDARTSTHKVNAGAQVRTHVGVDASLDFSYVSPQTWAEQVQNAAKQLVEYESFHLDAYTLVNASVGYRFLGNHAELRAVGFNLLDDRHREHPFGQVLARRVMGLFSYKF